MMTGLFTSFILLLLAVQNGICFKVLTFSRRSREYSRTGLCMGKVQKPPGFQTPEPKPLSVADGDYGTFLKGVASATVRLGSGAFVIGWSPFAGGKGPWPGTLGLLRDGSSLVSKFRRPSKPPVIYEYEASPFCRKVREAVTLLDLTVEYRPCPGARAGWSDQMAKTTNGVRTVPYLVDGDVRMFESDDIIEYLFDTYGPGRESIPWVLKGDFARNTAIYAASLRQYAGSKQLPNVREDIQSMIPVELWGYEASPFVRTVRETLCSLGLAHLMVSCGRGSQNRDRLYERTGRFQVPFLADPNTGVEMFESSEIVKYLLATYTVQ